MELQHTYRRNGKDAFAMHYKCVNIGKGCFLHELITTLPEQCLEYVHHTFFMRMTADYRPTTTEACRMLDKLSIEIFQVEKFKLFYFPDYLLSNGSLLPQQLNDIYKTQKNFRFTSGMHFSANTNSTEFAVLTKETNRFKVFFKKDFQRRFQEVNRKRFEEYLLPGRAALDYIELFRPDNKFYFMQQDSMQYYYLCNPEKTPLMIITFTASKAGLKNIVEIK